MAKAVRSKVGVATTGGHNDKGQRAKIRLYQRDGKASRSE
jgi:hypothetical protein